MGGIVWGGNSDRWRLWFYPAACCTRVRISDIPISNSEAKNNNSGYPWFGPSCNRPQGCGLCWSPLHDSSTKETAPLPGRWHRLWRAFRVVTVRPLLVPLAGSFDMGNAPRRWRRSWRAFRTVTLVSLRKGTAFAGPLAHFFLPGWRPLPDRWRRLWRAFRTVTLVTLPRGTAFAGPSRTLPLSGWHPLLIGGVVYGGRSGQWRWKVYPAWVWPLLVPHAR